VTATISISSSSSSSSSTPVPTCSPTIGNLLVNGDFEGTTSISPWVFAGNDNTVILAEADAPSGSNILCVPLNASFLKRQSVHVWHMLSLYLDVATYLSLARHRTHGVLARPSPFAQIHHTHSAAGYNNPPTTHRYVP
jgi:hypothetical protein